MFDLLLLIIERIRKGRAEKALLTSSVALNSVAKELQVADANYVDAARLSATLQIAFYTNAKLLQFLEKDTWMAGLYDIKNTGYGPYVTVFMRTLTYSSPHLYFDFKANNSKFRQTFPERIQQARLAYFEGYVSDKFDLYAPAGYTLDALVIGAPDALNAILQNHLGADIEILGNQLYYVFPERADLPRLLPELVEKSKILGGSLDDNLSRYIDDRSRGTNQPIANDGRWIIRQ